MNEKAKPKAEDRKSSATSSDKPTGVRGTEVVKVGTLDENFEHTLRRAAIEKEKVRSKNPGMYL